MNLEGFDAESIEKSSLRQKADRAKQLRSHTFICVLENPKNIANLGSVIRNVDALGVTKLYVITDNEHILNPSKKGEQVINKCSSSASKYVYTRYFKTTEECFDYLEKNNFTSFVTSPHIKGAKNMDLLKTDFTKYKKLAIWFGNESNGITNEAVERAEGCVQIEMAGIIESMNLSVSTGIVLNHISNQRREWKKKNIN